MAQTLAEKLVARAAGRASVTPGEIVTCRVDLAMVHDSSGPRRLKPMLERLGVGVWDPDRLVVITDHFVPAFDPASAAIQKLTRIQVSPVATTPAMSVAPMPNMKQPKAPAVQEWLSPPTTNMPGRRCPRSGSTMWQTPCMS